jgi:4-amino-4-deoxy-L-arabinose transferase-like glycosyltransferase
MIASGNYAIPVLEGHTYLKKPPLFYWLGAASSRLTGSSDEWAYRLPSAIAGLVTVLAFFALARGLLPARAALLAAAMLATCAIFLEHAARAQIDMTLACFVMVAMLCLARARASQWRSPGAVWGFWIATGLAVLTKGPVGFLFPLGAALSLAAAGGFRAEIRRMRILPGLAIVSAVFVPWGVLVVQRIGLDAALRLLYQEAFSAYAEDARSHAEPFYFYGITTLEHFLPWTAFLPAAVAALRERKDAAERRALAFAAAWFLPALVLLSLSHQKRSYYLLPAFGALALWHGWAVDRFVLAPAAAGEGRWPRRLARAGLFALGAAAAVGAIAGGAFLKAKEPALWALASAPLTALGIWGIFVLLSTRRDRPGRAIAAVVIGVVLAVGTQRGVMADWFNAQQSPRPFAEEVARRAPPDAHLVVFQGDLYFDFYVKRPVSRADTDEELERLLASGRPVFVVLEEDEYLARKALFRRRVLRFENYVHRGKTMILASN